MKKIVIINQHSSYLFVDIANSFAEKYEEVVFIAGMVRTMNTPLNPKVKIVKIKVYNKDSTLKRFMSWVVAFFQVIILLKTKYRKHEVFSSSNPPLLNLLPWITNRKTSLLIYDVYPDALIAMRFVKRNGLVATVWSQMNKLGFKRAHQLITITNGMKLVLSKYAKGKEFEVVPVWAADMIASPEIGTNSFLKKHRLEEKFLIVYSGNLGLGYNLEDLVNVAEMLQEHTKIHFLIVGNGYKREQIIGAIREKELDNCQYLPSLDESDFRMLLGATKIGVVCLDEITAGLAIPSKTFNLLSAAKPIICLGSEGSELASLIVPLKAGKAFNKTKVVEMREFILSLFNNSELYSFYSKNSEGLSLKFTKDNADIIVSKHMAETESHEF
jgi:glycosyltransferase involved in cell wall biosynthesis